MYCKNARTSENGKHPYKQLSEQVSVFDKNINSSAFALSNKSFKPKSSECYRDDTKVITVSYF